MPLPERFHYLRQFLADPAHREVSDNIRRHVATRPDAADPAPGPLREIYGLAAAALSRELEVPGDFDRDAQALLFHLYGELEFHLRNTTEDPRHDFIVVIPVADRPEMLAGCLESLLEHCRRFGYGGMERKKSAPPIFRKVRALIVDDSKAPAARGRHRALCERLKGEGLDCEVFGLSDQGQLLSSLSKTDQLALRHLLGTRQADNQCPPHKGASITRNLALLHLLRSGIRDDRSPEKILFWFVDSDEEFRIRLQTPGGPVDEDLLGYFHILDTLFSEKRIDVLTGRVVGDPPVAPAAMMRTLTADVAGFLQVLEAAEPDGPCPFHDRPPSPQRAAVYNDLVALFGYDESARPAPYCCRRKDAHTTADAAGDFASGLQAFFHGCHPTREILYNPEESFDRPVAARTVYTGNYVLRASVARAFIPFADLRLRMAGPTLGRLLKARLGDRFVTANLPLIHRRILSDRFRSEFRQGLQADDSKPVDFSEQIRSQFWGDCLLFAVQDLTGDGFPDTASDETRIRQAVERSRRSLAAKTAEVRSAIARNVEEARKRLGGPNEGQRLFGSAHEKTRNDLFRFLLTVERNIEATKNLSGSSGPKGPDATMSERLVRALLDYRKDAEAWEALCETGPTKGNRPGATRERLAEPY